MNDGNDPGSNAEATAAAARSELDRGLALALRLMSQYVTDPSSPQLLTVLHCLRRLDGHPAIANNVAAATAIAQATALWASHALACRAASAPEEQSSPGRAGDRHGGLH